MDPVLIVADPLKNFVELLLTAVFPRLNYDCHVYLHIMKVILPTFEDMVVVGALLHLRDTLKNMMTPKIRNEFYTADSVG